MAVSMEAREPVVGQILTPARFTIDGDHLAGHLEGLSIPAPSRGRLPTTVLSKPDNDFIMEAAFPDRTGHLWIRQEWWFLAPLGQGVEYDVTARVEDIYRKRNRNVVLYDARFTDPAGRLVARSQHHQSFLAAPRPGETVNLRDPSKKAGARVFEVPDGERFGGLERVITGEMCARFFQGKANYHTDLAASKALGFEKVVVGGRMTMAYLGHILESRFEDRWFEGGHLDIKFTNPVWMGDTVTAHGVVTGPAGDDSSREHAFVWVTRTDGVVAIVGRADVPAP